MNTNTLDIAINNIQTNNEATASEPVCLNDVALALIGGGEFISPL